MPPLQDRLQAAVAERYRIERELGAGGMATVYLAHDLRNDRRVAIKLFRPELSAVMGTERFIAEINVTGNLQHPHILPLFDSGTADGLLFYVMPFVEGESLRQRLDRERQLPIADAVRLAREVAEALDYAHRHGVIHRDIKPENILLHDGRALVADFGIALAVQKAGGQRITETGLSLGTPQYMSPEQATAEREIDARSDVYSLGCVLYEMLAGEPPHSGPSTQSVIAKILTEKPRPVTALRDTVPEPVAEAVHMAIAKLAADRHPSAAAFAAALGRTDATGATRSWAAPPARMRFSGAAVITLLVVAALTAAIGWALGRRSGASTASFPPSRLAILSAVVGGSGGAIQGRQVAITPDGSAVIYTATAEGVGNRLMYQRLDAEQPTPIPGSDGFFTAHVDPDGGRVIAINARSSRVLPIASGLPGPTALPPGTAFTSWHPDGSLWFSRSPYSGLARIQPGVDTIEVMVRDLPGLRLQQILDDGKHALMVQAPVGVSSGPVLLLELATGATRVVLESAVTQIRASSGLLVYTLGAGDLMAATADLPAGVLTGPPVLVGTNVVTSAGSAISQFAVSRNGTVVYLPEEPRALVYVNRDGTLRPALEQRSNFHHPLFSPDGRQIAVDLGTTADGRDVWILDREQGTLARATFDRDGHDAVWSLDGESITYLASKHGALGIYRTRPGAGASQPESVFTSPRVAYTGRWLPDGRTVVTVANDLVADGVQDLALLRPGTAEPITPLVATPFQEHYPAVSPDGRWLLFVSDQSGRREVYLRQLEGQGSQTKVSLNGGDEPVWARSGREFFHRETVNDQTTLVAVGLDLSGPPRVTSRQTLFSAEEYLASNPHANYDVAPDGQSFVMVRRGPSTRLVVVQNLPELVRRAGSGGGN